MEIYKRNPFRSEWSKKEWFWYGVGIFLKCLCIMVQPMLLAVMADVIWKKSFYNHGRHLDATEHEIVLIALLPLLALVYAMFATKFVESRMDKLAKLRPLVMRHTDEDYKSFVLLASERLSPIAHALLGSIAFLLLLMLMLLDYGIHPHLGYYVIGSVAYVLGLVTIAIVEIDNPFSGFWYINTEPVSGLWFKKTPREARAEFFPKLSP
jgi:hypothetical protein